MLGKIWTFIKSENFRDLVGIQIIDNWREIISHSGSWWTLIAGLMSLIVPEMIYAFFDIDTNPYFWGFLGICLYTAGIIGRLLKQSKSAFVERMRVIFIISVAILAALLFSELSMATPASEAEVLEIAIPFIAENEGERLHAYRPIDGDVPTICFGSTRNIRMGMIKTHEECLALLRKEIAEYRKSLHRFFTVDTINNRLPPKRDVAYIDTAYNCGIIAIGRSTATRRLNAGDIKGGCDALTWWNKFGNRIIRGLIIRRMKAYNFCIDGYR